MTAIWLVSSAALLVAAGVLLVDRVRVRRALAREAMEDRERERV